jgi:hypothetical protein
MNLSLIAVVIINTVFAFVLITINKFLYSRGSVFDIYGFPLVIILGNLGYIIYLFCYKKIILLFSFLILLAHIYSWIKIIVISFDSFINLSINEYLLLILIVVFEFTLPILIMILKNKK